MRTHRHSIRALVLVCAWLLPLGPASGASTRAAVASAPAVTVEGNRAVIARLFADVLNGGRLEILNRIIAPNYVEHSPAPGQAPGVAGVRAKIAGLRAAFPDIHFTLEAMVAQGDLVAARWHFTGTQTGKLGEIAPTGRSVRVDGIDFYRVVDGRIAAHWACEDQLGLLRQLGALK